VTRGATILMYHRVSTAAAEPIEGDYAIPTDLFERHLDVLVRLAIPVVPLSALREPATGARVVLTFDDGCETDAGVALPALRRRGFAGAFFVNPARVGEPGRLDWPQLARLRDAGMRIGSHGLDHVLFDELGDRELERQLVGSKRLLEDRLGVPIDALSLPGGSGGQRAARRARELGYAWVLGSRPGLARTPPVAPLPRFAIRAGHRESAFEALVRQRPGPRLWLAARWTLTRLLRAGLGNRGWERFRGRWVGGG